VHGATICDDHTLLTRPLRPLSYFLVIAVIQKSTKKATASSNAVDAKHVQPEVAKAVEEVVAQPAGSTPSAKKTEAAKPKGNEALMFGDDDIFGGTPAVCGCVTFIARFVYVFH
jgi:hypothetical protein